MISSFICLHCNSSFYHYSFKSRSILEGYITHYSIHRLGKNIVGITLIYFQFVLLSWYILDHYSVDVRVKKNVFFIFSGNSSRDFFIDKLMKYLVPVKVSKVVMFCYHPSRSSSLLWDYYLSSITPMKETGVRTMIQHFELSTSCLSVKHPRTYK